MKLQKLFFLGLIFINFASNGAEAGRAEVREREYTVNINSIMRNKPFNETYKLKLKFESADDFRVSIASFVEYVMCMKFSDLKPSQKLSYEISFEHFKNDGTPTDILNEIAKVNATVKD